MGWKLVGLAGVAASAAHVWRAAAKPHVGSLLEWPVHAGLLTCLLAMAFAAFLMRPPRRLDRDAVSLLLELAVVPVAVVAILWMFVVDPPGAGSASEGASSVFAWAYFATISFAALVLFVVALRLTPGGQHGLPVLLAGMVGVVVALSVWVTAWVNSGDGWSEASAAFNAESFTLLAIALGRERRRFEKSASILAIGDARTEPTWPLWAGDLLLATAGAAWIGRAVDAGSSTTDAVLPVCAALFVGLVAFRHGRSQQSAQRLVAALRDRSERDPLTNLINHRVLYERLEAVLAATRGDRRPVAVALIDVDRFKEINDRLGHVVGDHVLRAIAGTLNRSCRETDVAARYAGDEFALILPGLPPEHVALVGDRLLTEVASLGYWPGPDSEHPVSVSIGLAISRSGRRSARQMIAAADSALYEAKASGRNRFAVVNADLPDHDTEPEIDPRRLLTAHPAV